MDLKQRRLEVESEQEKGTIEDVAVLVIIEFCWGLVCKEVPFLSFKRLLEFWSETRKHKKPYVMIPLMGRFKGYTGDIWHLLPIADYTQS